MKKKNTILDVIDGNNWMNRAYHSTHKLTTSKGEHTGAAKTFIGMINKLIKMRTDKRGKCHLVVCFDSPSRNGFRRKRMSKFIEKNPKGSSTYLPEKYMKGYKGTRTKDPVKVAEFFPQFDIVKKILDARGIKWYEIPTYEADDIIGSIAFQMKCLVMVWSRDKDFAQLLCPRVRITQQGQGNSPEVKYTYLNCCEYYGINPEMFVDYLALCGDSADNIPGVPGVGSTTAVKLLNEYVDLEGIVAAAKSKAIKGKLGEKLSNKYIIKLLMLSRELAEIYKTLEVDTKAKNYLINDITPYRKALRKIEAKYEFATSFSV